MTDEGQKPQPGAPVPGWYTDGQGLVSCWDGMRWTDNVQTPAQPAEAQAHQPEPQTQVPEAVSPEVPHLDQPSAAPPTPEIPAVPEVPRQAQGPITPLPQMPMQPPAPAPMTTGTGFGEKSFLPWVIALGAVVALSVAAVLILGSAGEDDGSGTDAVPSQEVEDTQTGLRTAQTTLESYAIDNNGSYADATADSLVAIEPTLEGLPLSVSGTATGYTLSATAGDVTFSITRTEGGLITFTCDPPGGSGCDASGTWGLAT